MKRKRVIGRFVVLLLVLLLAVTQTIVPAFAAGMDETGGGVEPDAAYWGTWALESADELRPAAPPDAEATAAEIAELMAMAAMRDDAAVASVRYWDAGAPGYRWVEMTMAAYESLPVSFWTVRSHALVTVAIYDATIAAWDAKYAFNRPRPTDFDPALTSLIPTPDSPSYVSEYAAAAGAASTVLSYLFPANAELYAAKAEEAGRSRLLAGVAYPSDVEAGLALGRAVGEKVVAIALADGSDAQWDGTRPAGPGILTNEKPVFPMAGTWRTWALESGEQFRAPPPPAYDSEQTAAELAEIKAITRTIPIIATAIGWNGFKDGYAPWYHNTSLRLFESGLDRNAPQAALAYSAVAIASYDAMVACFDSKYAYWRIRPNQLDPDVTTIFPTPPHPSYPAAHSCSSTSVTNVIAHFFPADAASILAMGEEAGLSRIWAGIHYRSDIDAGSQLGVDVAGAVLARVGEMTAAKAENIVVGVTGAPVDANGIVGGEPTGINVFLSADGVDAAHFGDPRYFGHQIPAGGWMEIELGGTFERNGVDNDGELVAVDSNFYLIPLAGNAQNLIAEVVGEGVQHGNYTISDDGAHTILVTPNGGEGANGLEGERAAQIGLKTLHILPRRGSAEGPSPFTNGPEGTVGTVAVRIYNADGEMIESGEGSVTFTGPEQRHVAAVNFGLTDPGNPFLSETVHNDVFAASAYQIVVPGSQLISTQRGETFAAGGPYALRLLLIEAQDKQPDSYPPFMGIPGVGLVMDEEDASTAWLVQDSNGDGVLDESDESIGTVTITGPNGETDGKVLSPEGWPLTTAGNGVEGESGSTLNVPVQVGSALGYYEVTVSLDGGKSATVSVIVDPSETDKRIASAMSAGPSKASQEARIVDYPAGWPGKWPDEPAEELIELRPGSNGWTCIPDAPNTPGNDPICMNDTYFAMLEARLAKVDGPASGIGIGYMLQEGIPAGSPPHMMIFVPGIMEDLAAFSTEAGPIPWVMFPDTSYAHLMVTMLYGDD